MFALKYTSSLPELQKYLDEQLEEYMQKKALEEEQAFQVQTHYDEERRLLTEYVYRSPQYLEEMCFMAFLGYLAKEKKIKVSNVVTQCPFILYLLGVVSYDVFEEEYYEKELYPKVTINSAFYYVSENFYELCQEDIKQFLDQSGYVSMWVGRAPICSDSALNREPVGIVVLSMEINLAEHVEEFGKLYDATDCVLEENSLDLCLQGKFYEFLTMQQEKRELSEDESQIIEAYKNQAVDKQAVIKILGAGTVGSGYESYSSYCDAMEKFKDEIYSREDLYKYLLAQHIKEDKALYWTEMIRKGTLDWKLREHQISYQDYVELYFAVGKEKIDFFSNVRYMPSRWSVLEKFYRLTGQTDTGKVIAVDFDGTLSFGTWPSTGAANKELIDFLKERKKKGDKLILWTCREGDALQEAVRWCEREGLVFDAVNDNIPEMTERYGTNSRKVSCDYYIDDRAVWTNAFGLLR